MPPEVVPVDPPLVSPGVPLGIQNNHGSHCVQNARQSAGMYSGSARGDTGHRYGHAGRVRSKGNGRRDRGHIRVIGA